MAQDNTRACERIGADEVAALPALITTVEAAQVLGVTPMIISRRCAKGVYTAVKTGSQWRINKAKFLEAVGLA